MDVRELAYKYSDRYGFLAEVYTKDKEKYPPWAYRKFIEMTDALKHPDLNKELFVLSVSSHYSVWIHRKILQSYFAWAYKLTTETSYSLVAFFGGEDFDILSPFSQLTNITYHNDLVEGPEINAGPSDTEPISNGLRDELLENNNYIDIRIGASVHKSDLIWFVNKYWEEIDSHITRPLTDTKQIRKRNESDRNILEYTLRRNKIPAKERNFIHEFESKDIHVDYDILNTAYKQLTPLSQKGQSNFFSIALELINLLPLERVKAKVHTLSVVEENGAPYVVLDYK